MSAFSLSRPLAYAAVAISMLPLPAFAQSKEVNIYTTREPGLIQPMLDAFQEKTGIKANSIFVKEGLAERVKTEGANSPADLLIVVDIGNLKDLVDQGVTQPIVSKVLDSEVPANLRAADHSWTSLTLRARVIYASKDRVKDSKLTYEDLADPKWKGKVCTRSGKHPYNIALIASFIAKHGEAKTEEWLKGWKANLARKPAGGDREVARDILGGICDIGPANSYYVGLMRNCEGRRAAQVGRRDQRRVPDLLRRRRHAGERLGRRTRQECAEQGERDRAARLPGLAGRPEAVRKRQLRVPDRRRAESDHQGARNAEGRFPFAHRDRKPSQAGRRTRRPGRLRQLRFDTAARVRPGRCLMK